MINLKKILEKEKDENIKQEAKWYILQTYSGCENSVKNNLLQVADSMNMLDSIIEVVSPKEFYTEVKNDGKKKKKERHIYSGYIFIKMIMTQRSFYLVKNVPRVNGFLGSLNNHTKPVPLSEREIKPILMKIGMLSKNDLNYLNGKNVEIISGSFSGQICKVLHVDNQQEKVTVEIDLFGRSTPIEIYCSQFKEIN
ncbi:Transcription antitermination protein NusG [Candidatus Phytoplasma mali]|uniref:Transcription termination/antitermination protein NusG n=1 Tax=Phytoplasma mali (strain AT) TaxID=482235 RepID=B3QZG5_PHYMT|nr:transcription termination/antitermination protein NusG [Candidatus Phytoplasma mali]CAP18572.1 Transcription antitermination protein NusG [Candidatus Phytoplasma mali]